MERYERHKPFIPEQENLYNARILLAGCGAGSTLAPRLARMGVGVQGEVILADPDVVDITNLNRQEYNESDIGLNKAVALQARMNQINSSVNTRVETDGITLDNISELVSSSDIIVDMIDIAVPDIMFGLHAEAKKQKKPVITGLDVGEGIISYVFDYRDTEAMTLNGFVGLSEDATDEEIAGIPSFPLALQFIIGPVNKEFSSNDETLAYYNEFFDKQLEELFEAVPTEAQPVLTRLLEGELTFVPQTDTAATLLGVTHEKLVREITLGNKVPVVPDAIKLNLNHLLTQNLWQ